MILPFMYGMDRCVRQQSTWAVQYMQILTIVEKNTTG